MVSYEIAICIALVVFSAVYCYKKHTETYMNVPGNTIDGIESSWNTVYGKDKLGTLLGQKKEMLQDGPSDLLPDSTGSVNAAVADSLYNSGIDNSIRASQQTYLSDTIFTSTIGASQASIRDDYYPTVVQYGLPRKSISFKAVPMAGARSVPSESDGFIGQYAAFKPKMIF